MPEEDYVVVDGSNIATEGRSQPSLAQLDEAVRAFQQERPDAKLIVVVDATFGHRIDASERRTFEEGEAAAEAVAEATAEALAPKGGRRRRRGREPAEAVNEPLSFISFIADHQPGSEVEATVDSFTSHGAFVVADGARCYVPLTALGEPPPRSAKEVLNKGET